MAIYAIDFDNTLAITRFPEIVAPNKKLQGCHKPGEKPHKSRQGTRERKKYFAMQKLNGVALLIFTAVAIKILEGDATIAFITVPLGLSMLLSKEMLIINKYYWKCEEKAESEGQQ